MEGVLLAVGLWVVSVAGVYQLSKWGFEAANRAGAWWELRRRRKAEIARYGRELTISESLLRLTESYAEILWPSILSDSMWYAVRLDHAEWLEGKAGGGE